MDERWQRYKEKKPFQTRVSESKSARERYPTKVPAIVERYPKEKHLPIIDKVKFLVPGEVTIATFQTIIRNRLHLEASRAFFLFVNGTPINNQHVTMKAIYDKEKDADGYLYLTYASQEAFGCDINNNNNIDTDDLESDDRLCNASPDASSLVNCSTTQSTTFLRHCSTSTEQTFNGVSSVSMTTTGSLGRENFDSRNDFDQKL